MPEGRAQSATHPSSSIIPGKPRTFEERTELEDGRGALAGELAETQLEVAQRDPNEEQRQVVGDQERTCRVQSKHAVVKHENK